MAKAQDVPFDYQGSRAHRVGKAVGRGTLSVAGHIVLGLLRFMSRPLGWVLRWATIACVVVTVVFLSHHDWAHAARFGLTGVFAGVMLFGVRRLTARSVFYP